MSDGYTDMTVRGIRYLRTRGEPLKRCVEFHPRRGCIRLLAIDSGNQSQILEIGYTEIGRKMWLLIFIK